MSPRVDESVSCPLKEAVVQYTALIAHQLIHSTLEPNPEISRSEIERVFALDVNRTRAPSVSGPDRNAAWACLIMERALARLSPVKTRNPSDLEDWLRENYKVYGDEEFGSCCKRFIFKASLDQLGGVPWEFEHPEQGDFPVAFGPYRKGATVDQYVATIARIDLLKRAAALGAEI